jgi:hypothetical protein
MENIKVEFVLGLILVASGIFIILGIIIVILVELIKDLENKLNP